MQETFLVIATCHATGRNVSWGVVASDAATALRIAALDTATHTLVAVRALAA
jgi:hypothetical protein